MLWQSVKMAWSSILGNKLRSFLTMLGIIIGVLALVVLVSIASGATGQVTEVVASLGTNLLSVNIMDSKERPVKMTEVMGLSDLEYMGEIAPTAIDSMNLSAGGTSERAMVTGTTGGYFIIEGMETQAGRLLNQADINNHVNAVVVNEAVTEDILKTEEPWQAISMELSIRGIPYTVVGVLAEQEEMEGMQMFAMSPYTAYIPYTSLMRLSDSVANVTSFYCSADEDAHLDALEKELSNWLYKRLDEDDEAFSIINMSTIMSAMDRIMSAMTTMLGGIAAISLLVGGIGIMNIMLVSVTERTREIGIRKAIGATEGSILMQFLIEALLLSLLGCLLGILASWGILEVVNHVSSYSFAMEGSVVSAASAFSIMIGMIFGLYPARKAARKKPIDALHYGG